MSLTTVLTAARTALKGVTGTPQAIIRGTAADEASLPATAYFVLDLIPGAPTTTMDGEMYDELILQVGAWHPTSLTAAIALAQLGQAALLTAGYDRHAGVQLGTDEAWRGCITTYRMPAAFDDL